jgi:SET domain-containing protein
MKLKSWRSRSVQRRGGSLHDVGLFAIKDIKRGELLAVKAGRLVDEATVTKYSDVISGSHIQVGSNLFLSGLTPEEVDNTLIGFNHSCSPNAYISGQIELTAMKNIKAGEEITADYATFMTSDTQSFQCICGSPECRKLIEPSVDYKNPKFREKHRGYFASYIQREIDAGK